MYSKGTELYLNSHILDKSVGNTMAHKSLHPHFYLYNEPLDNPGIS